MSTSFCLLVDDQIWVCRWVSTSAHRPSPLGKGDHRRWWMRRNPLAGNMFSGKPHPPLRGPPSPKGRVLERGCQPDKPPFSALYHSNKKGTSPGVRYLFSYAILRPRPLFRHEDAVGLSFLFAGVHDETAAVGLPVPEDQHQVGVIHDLQVAAQGR